MSSSGGKKTSVPHLVRTAAEPRQNRLYNVHISHIEQVNPSIRLFQLAIPPQNVLEIPESDDAEVGISYSTPHASLEVYGC